MLIKHGVQRAIHQIRRHHLQEPLSQLAWLASVGTFARWTQLHFHAPAGGAAWVGMTIRTTTFAVWGQVAREWMALRWWYQPKQQN